MGLGLRGHLRIARLVGGDCERLGAVHTTLVRQCAKVIVNRGS